MNYTFIAFQNKFSDEEACFKYVFKTNRRACVCGKNNWKRVEGRKSYACSCGRHFYPLAGTIYKRSTTPLKVWFYAIYLNDKSSYNLSAKELQRHIGTTYKTAWRMQNKIRRLMTRSPKNILSGVLAQVDERVLGGNFRNYKRKYKRKKI